MSDSVVASQIITKWQTVLASMRLPFLALTPVCIFLGVATAKFLGYSINSLHVTIILIGGIAAHISVNAFNEYFDFKSGLDLKTQRTPFSGGSGALPQQPQYSGAVLTTAWISVGLSAAVGMYFLVSIGWSLLPLGLTGLALVIVYTTVVIKHPLLCLVAPGFGFGCLMVVGTVYILTGHYSWLALLVSMIPFLLVNDLLLLNQFPDIEADKSVGRRHLPIVLGARGSSKVYVGFLLLTYAIIIAAVLVGRLNSGSLLALLTLLLAVPTALGVLRNADNIQGLLPYMKFNVLINLLTPSLMAIGLLIPI